MLKNPAIGKELRDSYSRAQAGQMQEMATLTAEAVVESVLIRGKTESLALAPRSRALTLSLCLSHIRCFRLGPGLQRWVHRRHVRVHAARHGRHKPCKSFCILTGWQMGHEEGFQSIHKLLEALLDSTWLASPSLPSAVFGKLLQRLWFGWCQPW